MPPIQRSWQRGVSLCAYCGVNIATTGDHVIPKNLFVVKDDQMLTVPSCEDCQKAKGIGERDLRNYCTLEVGGSLHPNALELAERIVETNEATRNWLERTMAASTEVPLVDEDDSVVGTLFEIDFNSERILDTLMYIFRGLYWTEHGSSIPFDCPVEATFVPWSKFPDFMRKFGAHRRGEPRVLGNLVAWYSPLDLVTDDQFSSAWVLCINDGVGFYGATGAAALLERQRKQRQPTQTTANLNEAPRRVRAPRSSDGDLIVP